MSDNIFKEFCNRVLSFFKQNEAKNDSTKSVACNRLRVVLMQDRTNLTPELLQKMRQELVELLSKYVEMDKEALELNFDQEDGQMALMLSIPVIRAKEESEIISESEENQECEEKNENDSDSNSNSEVADDLDDEELEISEPENEKEHDE